MAKEVPVVLAKEAVRLLGLAGSAGCPLRALGACGPGVNAGSAGPPLQKMRDLRSFGQP